jgi:hypothetical protein
MASAAVVFSQLTDFDIAREGYVVRLNFSLIIPYLVKFNPHFMSARLLVTRPE